jgi:hypothetical protein
MAAGHAGEEDSVTERRIRLTDRRGSHYVRRPMAEPWTPEPAYRVAAGVLWDLGRLLAGALLIVAFGVAIFWLPALVTP